MTTDNLLIPLTQRRSIRKFTDKLVEDKLVEKIVEIGQRAPLAGEFYSIIWVKDPKIKEQIPYVRQSCPVLLIVCVDFRKAERFTKLSGNDLMDVGSWLFLWGIIDASLVLQNMITACEILGLGSILMGGIPREMDKACKLLKIPQKVFPIIGLGIGYPDEKPPLRPRSPLDSVFFIDEYQNPSDQEVARIAEYMNKKRKEEGYYKKYGQIDDDGIGFKEDEDYDWLIHFARKFGKKGGHADEIKRFGEAMRKQGILLKPLNE